MKELICKNCGARLTYMADKEIFVCQNCNSAFTDETESTQIVNNNVYNNVSNNTVTKIIDGKEVDDAKEYADRASNRLKLKDFDGAESILMEGMEYYPNNVALLMCMVRCKTRNYEKLFDTTHLEYYRKACELANEREIVQIKAEYNDFNMRKASEIQNDDNRNKRISKMYGIIGVLIAIGIVVVIIASSL